MAPPTSPPSILNYCWALCVFVDFSHPLVSAPLCHSSRRFAQIESEQNEIRRKFEADKVPVIIGTVTNKPLKDEQQPGQLVEGTSFFCLSRKMKKAYSSLNPSTWRILICLTMVLLPDSPAPE